MRYYWASVGDIECCIDAAIDVWNTQTANQAIGTGWIVGHMRHKYFAASHHWLPTWIWGFGSYARQFGNFYRAVQSASIGFGAL